MTHPQQPELQRQQLNPSVQEAREIRAAEAEAPDVKGESGPVPEANQPGHHPEREQDKPEGAPGAEADADLGEG